jgi:DNA-binding Lrp family transcriptional regulator
MPALSSFESRLQRQAESTKITKIMKEGMSIIERRVLAVLQQGLPQSQCPYKDMARQIGIDTGQLLGILEDWKQQSKLRRIGAIVNHFKAGLGAGAMVVWQVEPERVTQVGEILAKFEEVSHAYERHKSKNWPYNVYTMVHAKSAEDIQQIVLRMSRACGISNYRILVTEKELKKAPPTYVQK